MSQVFPATPFPSPQQASHAEESWVDLEGCPVRYLRCGSGPPLVLVHGLLGSAFCWRCNMEALGRVRTVYALDMPGLGYSGRIAAPECSLTANAERLLAFMTACGIERADLLGSSHGGAIALMASALSPERVNRLLLIAPAHPWMREHRLLITLAASRPGARLVRALQPQLAKLHGYFLRRMYADPTRIAPGTVEGYSAPMQIPGTLDHLLAIVRCWKKDMLELAEVLPELRPIPTFLLWGSRDTAVRPSAGGMLARFFDNCEMQMIFGAGHLPFEEFPDEFNSRVVAYLNRRATRL